MFSTIRRVAGRHRLVTLSAGVVLVGALGAGPALALGLQQGGGQPPAGTGADTSPVTFVPGTQPAPGTAGTKASTFKPGSQPANARPQKAGAPTTASNEVAGGRKDGGGNGQGRGTRADSGGAAGQAVGRAD